MLLSERGGDDCCVFGFHTALSAFSLTTEEMFPYVHRVLGRPRAWAVQKLALLTLTRLEKTKSRKLQRSTEQLSALVDVYRYSVSGCMARSWAPTEKRPPHLLRSPRSNNEASAAERLAFFYSTALPPQWQMQVSGPGRWRSVRLHYFRRQPLTSLS